MTNYTKTTDFAAKDSLPSGDSGKIIRGSEFETEFDNIATAVNSKADSANPTFTGTVTIDGLTVNGNTVLGNAATDTVTVTADIASNLIPSADDTYNLGASGAEWNDLYVDGVAYIDTIDGFATTGNVTFGDNDKAIFGASSDLQIYHDTFNSYVKEAGTGNLLLDSNNAVYITGNDATAYLATFNVGGASSLFYNGSSKLATTSTGVDVTGTVTADGLTVDGTGTFNGSPLTISNVTNPRIDLIDTTNNTDARIQSGDAGSIAFLADQNNEASGTSISGFVDGIQTFKSDAGGDFSLYENTGTTAKFFWDASAERLGIGTTSPGATLDVDGTVDIAPSSGDAQLKILNSADTGRSLIYFSDPSGTGGRMVYNHASNFMSFETNGTNERMRIDANGNVGIGTTSPASSLEVKGSTATSNKGATVLINDSAALAANVGGAVAFMGTDGTDDRTYGLIKGGKSTATSGSFDGYLSFQTRANGQANTTEAMRIDSSGNLLVGKTSADTTNTVGAEVQADGQIKLAADGKYPLELNRLTSDGKIAEFRKDGSTVGSIGANLGDVYIGTGDTTIRFADSADAIVPRGANGSERDAAIGLGNSANRFKDIYLSDGAYLGGTAAANKLDDYEEGTWTPAPQNYEGTMTVNSATYTKIGNTVTLRCDLSFDSTSDGSGVNLVGLPFNHTGSNKGNGGFCTKDTSGTTEYVTGEGSASILLYNDSYGNVTYTDLASGSVAFVYIYETTA